MQPIEMRSVRDSERRATARDWASVEMSETDWGLEWREVDAAAEEATRRRVRSTWVWTRSVRSSTGARSPSPLL